MQERCTFEEALCLFGGGVPLGLSLHRLSDDLRIVLAKVLTKLRAGYFMLPMVVIAFLTVSPSYCPYTE